MQKELPVRKCIRLKGYDYASTGSYFVTFCVKDGHEMLGRVVGATALGRPYLKLTPLGECVKETIQKANKDGVRIEKYVIMPNHVHMIVLLSSGDRGRSPLQHVVRNIKAFVTKWAGYSMWQKSFYDHIIRDESEYQKIWHYIDQNPAKWTEDRYYIQGEKARWDS